jgi:periplasmic nitrate reductase NapE
MSGTQIKPGPSRHDIPTHSRPVAYQGEPEAAQASPRFKRELILFLVLAVFIWPFIAVGLVAGWGFVVWMYYLLAGPPGPV